MIAIPMSAITMPISVITMLRSEWSRWTETRTYDDGSADCLDNRKLEAVLRHAHRALGRKVDVVGMRA